MRPAVGSKKPVIMANKVVLPAPFGPITAVMRPLPMLSDASCTARRPPKCFEIPSTAKIGSTMRDLPHFLSRRHKPSAQLRHDAGDAARRKCNHQDQDDAIDNEIEAGDVAGNMFGRFAQRFDHQSTEKRAKYGADA